MGRDTVSENSNVSSNSISSNSIYWVHLLRVMAVMFVVLLHASAQILQLDVEFASFDWWVGNIIDSSMRMCVPLLFMITGYLLLGKSESLGTFFHKRFRRIAIPLLAWTAIYVVWILLVESKDPTPISPFSAEISTAILSFFPVSLLGLLFAPAYYHLWFMYVLIGMYLCLPLLRSLVKNADKTLLWYFIGLWSVATFVFSGIKAAGLYNLIDLSMVSGSVGFLVLGYLLGGWAINRRLYLSMWLVYIVSVAITAIGTWGMSSDDTLNQTFYGNVPSLLSMVVSVFIIVRYLAETSRFLQSAWIKALVLSLSSCTFGIYLVHALFFYIFHKGLLGFNLDSLQGNPLIFIPLTAIVVYICSFLVVSFIKKLPYVRIIV